jgi:hypothetical protein
MMSRFSLGETNKKSMLTISPESICASEMKLRNRELKSSGEIGEHEVDFREKTSAEGQASPKPCSCSQSSLSANHPPLRYQPVASAFFDLRWTVFEGAEVPLSKLTFEGALLEPFKSNVHNKAACVFEKD